MRILFGADFHSDWGAYHAFARALTRFDVGVLGGDLMDEFITQGEAEEFGLIPREYSDKPDELFGPDEVPDLDAVFAAAIHNPRSINRRGLELKRAMLQGVLQSAGKPVLLIRGNHDLAEWSDTGSLGNIENRRWVQGGVPFVGFDYSGGRHSEEARRQALETLVPLVDGHTIFVTHCPPLGTLDETDHGSIGSQAVTEFVVRTRPRWILCGHVHEAFGRRDKTINGAWAREGRFVSLDTNTGRVRYLRVPHVTAIQTPPPSASISRLASEVAGILPAEL